MIRTDRFGEVLLNLPLLRALREIYPHAHLVFMIQPRLKELLEGIKDIDELIVYEQDRHRPWWLNAMALANRLRNYRFHLVLISNPHREFHVATFLAGIPIRVGYGRKLGWLLTHRLQDDKALGEQHELEYNLRLLTPLGITAPRAPTLCLPVSEGEEHGIRQLLNQWGILDTDRLVAIHPWTSNPAKQWPVQGFRTLIQQLACRPTLRVVVIGGGEERKFVSDVLQDQPEQVVDLVGKVSVKQLAALLKRAQVLITNDSGPMHLAAAVGTPVVALFGTHVPGSHPKRWGPWGAGHTVIHKPLSELSVEDVMRAVEPYVGGV